MRVWNEELDCERKLDRERKLDWAVNN